MPEALATSTAHTRSITNSWSASRISAGFLITTLFSILVREEPDGMPGGLGQGTESLTGVLEATVRDPYRSGPRRQTDQRDHGITGSQGQLGVGRHPSPFSRPQDVTGRSPSY